jgi:hypothetical protein
VIIISSLHSNTMTIVLVFKTSSVISVHFVQNLISNLFVSLVFSLNLSSLIEPSVSIFQVLILFHLGFRLHSYRINSMSSLDSLSCVCVFFIELFKFLFLSLSVLFDEFIFSLDMVIEISLHLLSFSIAGIFIIDILLLIGV